MTEKISKNLKDMTLEELWKLFPIELVAHREVWIEWARDEIDVLNSLLSDYNPIINHIGSTAIKDIFAKPIIDILVEVDSDLDWEKIKVLLEHNGYLCMSASETRMSFNKGYTLRGFAEKVFHVHLRIYGDNDEIYFRDFLMAHDEIAKEYEQLKLSLLPRFKNDRDGYTEAKTDIIKRVMRLAKTQRGEL